MSNITATYSPEDNKIRLYPAARLDAETFARVKEAGFKWAPKQELFVAPKWTPAREDLAIELAGEIEPEEMTLAERAEIKAERLDNLAHKRNAQANAYARRADELSEAFYMGQPILVGHHSERKARKTQERMHSAMDKAGEATRAANYWLYRAEGVERFANMKNDPRTRANRIKTLLAELRDLQRGINDAHKALDLWAKFTTDDQIRHVLGNVSGEITLAGYGLYSEVVPYGDKAPTKTPAEAREICIARAELRINGPTRRRWIEHILNRLAFERSMLGDVPRFEGELTPVILQTFARTHGAEKPKASETDPGSYEIESPVPLPLHLASGRYLDMTADEWRDLMQSTGYEVPAAKPRRKSSKPAPAPLVNPTAEQAEQLQRIWNLQMVAECKAKARESLAESNEVTALTQEVYSRNSGGSYSPLETIEISADGRRVHRHRASFCGPDDRPAPIARIRVYKRGTGFYKPFSVVHISDKPAKPLPVDLDAIERQTMQEIADAGEAATLGGAPYNPDLLRIKRSQPSTTQGEVVLFYNGRKIERYGDTIRRNDLGEYRGHPDEYWHDVARRALETAAEKERAAA